MSTTPLTSITNPPRCPLEDPISTFVDESETPATTVPTPLSRQQGRGDNSERDIARVLGNVAKRFPGKPKERGTRVTLPWLRWFNFVDVKVTEQADRPDSTSDPWLYDFSSEDFWSNVGGPGVGSWDVIDAEPNHPGIQSLVTDVNNGDITSIFVPVAANAGMLRWDQIKYGRFVFRTPPTLTSCRFEVGMSSDPRASWPATVFEAGSDMVYMFFDTAVDTALRFRVRVGGSLITNLTIVDPCPASTWIDVNFIRRLIEGSYALDCVLNGVLKTTVTTGLSSDSTAFGGVGHIGTRTAAARRLDIDFVDMRPTNVSSQRFDTVI